MVTGLCGHGRMNPKAFNQPLRAPNRIGRVWNFVLEHRCKNRQLILTWNLPHPQCGAVLVVKAWLGRPTTNRSLIFYRKVLVSGNQTIDVKTLDFSAVFLGPEIINQHRRIELFG